MRSKSKIVNQDELDKNPTNLMIPMPQSILPPLTHREVRSEKEEDILTQLATERKAGKDLMTDEDARS